MMMSHWDQPSARISASVVGKNGAAAWGRGAAAPGASPLENRGAGVDTRF
jgi:hypothetical protein